MPKKKLAILAIIFSNTIWGAGSPIFKWSLSGISPFMLAFYRFLIPTLILLFFYKKMQKPRMKDALYIILLGVLNCTFNIGLYLWGLLYAPSINSPVIGSSGPILIILGSALFLRDKASKRVIFGNLIGLTGVLFIVLGPFLQTHQPYTSFLGNMLFIFATISASLGTLVSKKLSTRYNGMTLTFWTFLIATITLIPFPIDQYNHHIALIPTSFPGIFGVLFGGIFSSLLAYGIFYWGLRYIKASETTLFNYIDPVIAVIIAAPLLHEYPTPIFIAGSVLVFFGIYIAERRIHWHPIHKLFE